jgi:hypothetical protein
MAALKFLRHYSELELMVFGSIGIVAAMLLGLLTNAILGPRGFGIFGNSFVIALGWAIAVIFHDALSRRPDFVMLGFADLAVLTALTTVCTVITLLGGAFMKKYFA